VELNGQNELVRVVNESFPIFTEGKAEKYRGRTTQNQHT
jgi:hypothetical protein